MLFRTYDVNVLSIVYSLADKRHVLEAKNGKVFLKDIFFPQNMHRLKVKSPLAKYGTYESTSLDERFDLFKDLFFSVRWRTDYNYVSIRHNIFSITRNNANISHHVSSILPR